MWSIGEIIPELSSNVRKWTVTPEIYKNQALKALGRNFLNSLNWQKAGQLAILQAWLSIWTWNYCETSADAQAIILEYERQVVLVNKSINKIASGQSETSGDL